MSQANVLQRLRESSLQIAPTIKVTADRHDKWVSAVDFTPSDIINVLGDAQTEPALWWQLVLTWAYRAARWKIPKAIAPGDMTPDHDQAGLDAMITLSVMVFIKATGSRVTPEWIAKRRDALVNMFGVEDPELPLVLLDADSLPAFLRAAPTLKKDPESWEHLFKCVVQMPVDAADQGKGMILKFASYSGVLPYQLVYTTLIDPLSLIVFDSCLMRDTSAFIRAAEAMLTLPGPRQRFAKQLLPTTLAELLEKSHFPMLHYIAVQVAAQENPTLLALQGYNKAWGEELAPRLEALIKSARSSVSKTAQRRLAESMGANFAEVERALAKASSGMITQGRQRVVRALVTENPRVVEEQAIQLARGAVGGAEEDAEQVVQAAAADDEEEDEQFVDAVPAQEDQAAQAAPADDNEIPGMM